MCGTVVELREYLNKCKNTLKKFEEASCLKPAKEKFKHFTCSINQHHRVPENKLEQHTKRCKWRKLGYSRAEVSEILNEERTIATARNLSINQDKIISKIAPSIPPIRNESRYKSDLNPGIRLQIYEEIVQSHNTFSVAQETSSLYADLEAASKQKLKAENENLTELQIQQKLRDAKRRRQSYKNKNVHTANRSQTEVMRDLIAVHMDELKKSLEIQKDVQNYIINERNKRHNRVREHHRERKRKRSCDDYERKMKKEDRQQRDR